MERHSQEDDPVTPRAGILTRPPNKKEGFFWPKHMIMRPGIVNEQAVESIDAVMEHDRECWGNKNMQQQKF